MRRRAFWLSTLFVIAVAAAELLASRAVRAADPLPTNSIVSKTNSIVEKGELTIFAASSLQETFRALADRFTAAHPIAVHLSFAGSQELRTQLEEGAQADLFASADRRHAEALQKEGVVAAPKPFAYNALVIAVPKGNPAGVKSLADLTRLSHLAIGAHEVPVGAYAEKLFALADEKNPGLRAALEKRISSRELNVRQVLAKVSLGEADAGIVYRTDALALANQVDAIALPPELEQRTEDLIAVVMRAKNSAAANAFVDFLLSAAGQQELQGHGFIAAAAP